MALPYWTREKVDQVFDNLRMELGRTPSLTEFGKKYGGGVKYMVDGRYDPEIRTWNQYLDHRNLEPNVISWTPKKVDQVFDNLKADVGRTPTTKEFSKKHGGAITCIVRGRYDPEIRTWGQYLRHRGVVPDVTRVRRFWTNEKIDEAFDEMRREFGRIPKCTEFRKRNEGAISYLYDGRYDPGIMTWGRYLKSRDAEPVRFFWTQEKVDRAFDEMMSKLGKTPTSQEFFKIHRGTRHYITGGGYDPKIKTWNKYLEYRTVEPNFTSWTPEKINEAFDMMKIGLDRAPKFEEFRKKHAGAITSIKRGGYDPEIRTWGQYLRHRNVASNVTYWTNEKVDQVFDAVRSGLGRTPTSVEFRIVHAGALNYISKGLYSPTIKKWDEYLEHRNVEPSTNFWTSDKLDQLLDIMITDLGRTPSLTEFRKKNKGAVNYIFDGKYNPKIKTWKQYLKFRNIEAARFFWTPEKADKVFDGVRDELGRIPTKSEFARKFGGAANYVTRGLYNPEIKNWAQYLEFRGLAYETPIKTPDQLQTLFEQEPIARLVAERFGQPEDVADVLAVIYSDRISRETMMELMEQPSLSNWLGKIRKPDTGIGPIVEAGTHILPLDKGGVIRDIIARRVQEVVREKLGPNPTPETRRSVLEELERDLHEVDVGVNV